ncbi:MAG TPA: hypothetical protein VK524_23825 [Polyangiaceae bacterium]|nr:hypothetical protein [Polyangiaceae bacterium]
MAWDYVLYGLRVRSDLELDAEPGTSHDSDVRLVLESSGSAAVRRPEGNVLAEYGDDERGFWIVETAAEYKLGISALLEACIDRDFTRIRIAPAASAPPDVVSTFAQGAILGTLLTLRGACVLHASAVEIDGRGVAFLGPSGCGKSMLAALCCAAGGRLLTDDLLLLRDTPDELFGQRGTTRLRLRQSSADLAVLLAADSRPTADDRVAVSAPVAPAEVPVDAILLPERTSGDCLELVRLPAAGAAISIISHPRIPGWWAPRFVASSFHHAARVARATPVYALRVPQEGRTPQALAAVVREALHAGTTHALEPQAKRARSRD